MTNVILADEEAILVSRVAVAGFQLGLEAHQHHEHAHGYAHRDEDREHCARKQHGRPAVGRAGDLVVHGEPPPGREEEGQHTHIGGCRSRPRYGSRAALLSR